MDTAPIYIETTILSPTLHTFYWTIRNFDAYPYAKNQAFLVQNFKKAEIDFDFGIACHGKDRRVLCTKVIKAVNEFSFGELTVYVSDNDSFENEIVLKCNFSNDNLIEFPFESAHTLFLRLEYEHMNTNTEVHSVKLTEEIEDNSEIYYEHLSYSGSVEIIDNIVDEEYSDSNSIDIIKEFTDELNDSLNLYSYKMCKPSVKFADKISEIMQLTQDSIYSTSPSSTISIPESIRKIFSSIKEEISVQVRKIAENVGSEFAKIEDELKTKDNKLVGHVVTYTRLLNMLPRTAEEFVKWNVTMSMDKLGDYFTTLKEIEREIAEKRNCFTDIHKELYAEIRDHILFRNLGTLCLEYIEKLERDTEAAFVGPYNHQKLSNDLEYVYGMIDEMHSMTICMFVEPLNVDSIDSFRKAANRIKSNIEEIRRSDALIEEKVAKIRTDISALEESLDKSSEMDAEQQKEFIERSIYVKSEIMDFSTSQKWNLVEALDEKLKNTEIKFKQSVQKRQKIHEQPNRTIYDRNIKLLKLELIRFKTSSNSWTIDDLKNCHKDMQEMLTGSEKTFSNFKLSKDDEFMISYINTVKRARETCIQIESMIKSWENFLTQYEELNNRMESNRGLIVGLVENMHGDGDTQDATLLDSIDMSMKSLWTDILSIRQQCTIDNLKSAILAHDASDLVIQLDERFRDTIKIGRALF